MIIKLETYREIVNKSKVIIANRDTGAWIKISKECRDILNDAIISSLTRDELISKLVDGEDRQYMGMFLNKLEELGVISEVHQGECDLDVVYLLVTNRCNLKCIHCCADALNEESEAFENELGNDALKIVIDMLASANPKGIAITGGEPMVRRDFFEILKYLRFKYKGKIALGTNATLITKENVVSLVKYIDNFDISVDGIDEDTCSKVRGKGVYRKVINSINLLKSYGASEISLSMTFGISNYYMRQDFLDLNKELGTKPIVRIFMPKGRGEKSAQYFNAGALKEPETEFTPEDIVVAKKSMRAITCGAGTKEFVINYDGWIYPCPNMIMDKYKLIHVNEVENLREIRQLITSKKHEGVNNLLKVQPENLEKCKECKVNLFCWSCLEDIALKLKDDAKFQKRCEIQKKILYPILWEN